MQGIQHALITCQRTRGRKEGMGQPHVWYIGRVAGPQIGARAQSKCPLVIIVLPTMQQFGPSIGERRPEASHLENCWRLVRRSLEVMQRELLPGRHQMHIQTCFCLFTTWFILTTSSSSNRCVSLGLAHFTIANVCNFQMTPTCLLNLSLPCSVSWGAFTVHPKERWMWDASSDLVVQTCSADKLTYLDHTDFAKFLFRFLKSSFMMVCTHKLPRFVCVIILMSHFLLCLQEGSNPQWSTHLVQWAYWLGYWHSVICARQQILVLLSELLYRANGCGICGIVCCWTCWNRFVAWPLESAGVVWLL